jgi:bifunctional ADP-heptose synthase (sugar kinase/adenylyltransferase)
MMQERFNFRLLVLGDIIVDHDILARKSGRPHKLVEREIPYQVERRYTTAGGAAIGARFLAMVNEGDTYLAGFSAPSMWSQALSDIMDQSRIYDNCPREVKLLCVWTAEGRGPVVSRLVELDDKGMPDARPIRWDDPGELTWPTYKRQALPDLIERVHRQSPFDGIIINDKDRGTLDEDTVKRVTSLARADNIPVVVDPKWSRDSYRDIEALAFTPNLWEWCWLVDETANEDYYKRNLKRPFCLQEIAKKAIVKFPNFRYHIITCDADGVILIGPVGEGIDLPIHHVPAVDIGKGLKQGPGDVFAAQFLAAYLSTRPAAGELRRPLPTWLRLGKECPILRKLEDTKVE